MVAICPIAMMVNIYKIAGMQSSVVQKLPNYLFMKHLVKPVGGYEELLMSLSP